MRALLKRPVEPPVKCISEPFAAIVTDNPKMHRLIEEARRIASAPCPVLLVGETGTGKDLFARAIHKAGCPDRPFVALNCAAVAPSLLESELFGHAAGSFTGAARIKKGLLEEAAGGTIFLDEIDRASTEFQAKLLRFLDGGEFYRVGETRPRLVETRVLSAMSRDPEKLVSEGTILPDLLYRLKGIRFDLPPLREREGDVSLLAEHFLAQGRRTPGRTMRVSPAALEVLARHYWPGNVRELKSLIERAVLLSESSLITPASLGLEEGIPFTGDREEDACRPVSPLIEAERVVILESLQKEGGNVVATSRHLGISRSALYRRMNRLGVVRPGA